MLCPKAIENNTRISLSVCQVWEAGESGFKSVQIREKQTFHNPVSLLALLSKHFVTFENLDNCEFQRRNHKYVSNSSFSFANYLSTTFLCNPRFFLYFFHDSVVVITRSSLVLSVNLLLRCLTMEMLWFRLLRQIRNKYSSEQQRGRKLSIIKLRFSDSKKWRFLTLSFLTKFVGMDLSL